MPFDCTLKAISSCGSCGVYLIDPGEPDEERLIEYERRKRPDATRLTCLQLAIGRWEEENR